MAWQSDISPLDEDMLWGLDNQLFDDDVGRALVRLWRLGILDSRTKAMAQHRIRKHRFDLAMSGTPFRQPKCPEGDFIMGFSLGGEPVRVPVQFLNAHVLVVSGSGGGKTTLARFHALQIAPLVRGMWLIDLRKQEFRVLRPLFTRMGIDLVVLPVRAMKINPLQVPAGVTPSDWAPRVADMLIEVMDIPPRASKLIQTILFQLYRERGVLDGSRNYPCLFDLYDRAKQYKEANAPARAALMDGLEPILWSLGPQVLGYRCGWSSSDLAKMHLAIEFAGVGEVEKNLLLNSLILPEFTSRVARGVSNQKMDLHICCDEAQRLCSSSASGQSSAIADLIGLVRGTGIGLSLSVLSTSGLSHQVISNTATKIMGRCGSAADYAAAGSSMGLTPSQIQWTQLNLRPGLFIGQLGEGIWRQPFVFTVPPMNLAAGAAEDYRPDDDQPQKFLPLENQQ